MIHCRALRLMLLFALVLGPLFGWAGGGFAADSLKQEKIDQLLMAIDQKAASIKTIDCRFEQQRFLAIFTKPVLFSGRLALERPSKLRWEITKPIPSALVFNGRKGLQCQGEGVPRTFDLSSDPIMGIVAQQLWGWLSGNYSELREAYTMELLAENILSLTPRDAGAARYISRIEIAFDGDTLQPAKVIVHESQENRTEITFFDYELNKILDEHLFTVCSLE